MDVGKLVELNAAGRTILFSGGVGRPFDPLLVSPEPARRVDYLILESTYGNRETENPLVRDQLGLRRVVFGIPDWLGRLRKVCSERGIVLIFDEVMTSRLHPGGLSAKLGLEPDLKTLGKYVGGGMSFGAFGGRRDIMGLFDMDATHFK